MDSNDKVWFKTREAEIRGSGGRILIIPDPHPD
jgi:hypothetical protein